MQKLIRALQDFWADQGCVLLQPYDMPMGAGTFHPATAISLLKRYKWKAAYVQGCRRPADGRYGENPLRLQHYYQFQVVMKPSPSQAQALYLRSLEELGIERRDNDIRFVEDNWKSPTMGAFGIGWEVWLNGLEISQFTYMQTLGGSGLGIDLEAARLGAHSAVEARGRYPQWGDKGISFSTGESEIPLEITYGLERIAMHLQEKSNVFEIKWDNGLTYGDLFSENELQSSKSNFEHYDGGQLKRIFVESAEKGKALVSEGLYLAAWEQCLTMSHAFNLLDAGATFSTVEREKLIKQTRMLATAVAQAIIFETVNQ